MVVWLPCWLAGQVAGWPRWLAGCLAGYLAGPARGSGLADPGGWLAACLAGEVAGPGGWLSWLSQSASVASQAQPAKRGRWMGSQSALHPAINPCVDYMDNLINSPQR